MGSGVSKRSRSTSASGHCGDMSFKGSDQHLRELLLEKTGEMQRLKAENER